MKTIFKIIAVTVSGCFIFLSFPTFDLFPLTWIALIPLLWVIQNETPGKAFLYGWLAGTVTNTGGFYWITGLLQEFAHMSITIAVPICLLLTAYQGLQYGLWAYLARKIIIKTDLNEAYVYPITFTVIEFLLPMIFPWYLANSQYKFYAIIQICEITGVLGLTFLIVLVNYALFVTIKALNARKPLPRITLAVAVGAFMATVVFGIVRIHIMENRMADARQWKIGLVEGNIGIWEKEAKYHPPEHRDKLLHHNLLLHHQLSRDLVDKEKIDLLIWPESSYQGLTTGIYLKRSKPTPEDFVEKVWIPRETTWFYQSTVPLPVPRKFPENVIADLENTKLTNLDKWAVQRDFKVPLLFGAISYRMDPERPDGFAFYNTAFLIDEDGKTLGAYDKTYLLMFGEYLPLVHYWPALEAKIRKLLPEAGDFVPGKTVEVIPYKGVNIGIMICYEDIIPAFTRKLAGKDPHIIINVTNDAWFGKTTEPYLHLALAVFRAIENRVALIRSTNTGVSAYIDPVGRIYAQTDLDNAETLVRNVPLLESKTIYRYLGDYFGYMNVAAGVLFLGYGFTRSRGKGSTKKKSKSPKRMRKEKKPGNSPAKATAPARKRKSPDDAAESGKRSFPR